MNASRRMISTGVAIVCGACLSGAAQHANAEVVEGSFEGIVTAASDPGQAAFGRDPSLWVGKSVHGTFRYDVTTMGVRDSNAGLQSWTYVAPWGLEWVETQVVIDGIVFTARSPDLSYAITGTVQVWDNSFGAGDWYSVQAASIRIGGRKVVGFDVFGPPDLLSYTGADGRIDFEFDQDSGAVGRGIVEDLSEPGGVVQHHGLIQFRLTGVTFGVTPAELIADLLSDVLGAGPGSSLADKITIVQAYHAAGDLPAACVMLTDFQSQVSAQAGKKLTLEQAAGLAGQAQTICTALGCE